MKSVFPIPSALRHEEGRRAFLSGLALLTALGILVLGMLAEASLTALTASASPLTERYVLSGEKVEISDLAGAVRIVPATGNQTEVIVTRGGRDADQLNVLRDQVAGTARLRIGFRGSRLVYPAREGHGRTTVSVDRDGCLPGKQGMNWRRVTIARSGAGPQAWADLEVRVPRGQRTVIRLGVGRAEARQVDADLSLDMASSCFVGQDTKGHLLVDTGSGSVSLDGHRGEVAVDTGSGSVEVTDIVGPALHVDTGSGSVRGSGVQVDDLLADTGSGGVRLASVRAGKISVDTGSGGVVLDLLNGPGTVMVDTGSGGVTITGPARLDAEVELESGSGGIEIDYPISHVRREHGYMAGVLGNGGARIHVDTGSGSIHLLSH